MTIQMKAALATAANTPLTLSQLPVPQPKANEVLIKVIASGINPLDLKIAAGAAPHAKQPFPSVLGMDTAGIVEQVGAEVDGFKIGDRVYGMVGGIGGYQGSLAEYQAIDAALLARAPDNLPLAQAASLPLIFITAWEGIVDRAQVSEGKTVLVHGGAGGVGHMAVQIARAFDAKVFATGLAKDAETIRSLGATPIDFTTNSVEQYVEEHTGGRGFDIVYDTVGGEVLDNAFKAAKTYVGHVVSCLGWGTHSIAPLSFRGATYSGVFTLLPIQTGIGRDHHGHILAQATQLVESGQLRVRQDPRQFTLTEVNEAHQYVNSGSAEGKVAVSISAE